MTLLSKLSSFCAKVLLLYYGFIFIILTHLQPPLLISSNDCIHHKLIDTFLLFASVQFLTSKIVIILILEHACLSHTSQSKPTRDEALDQAYSQYCASNIHINLTKHFCASLKEYSIIQFTEFILKHHLWWLCLKCSCLPFHQFYKWVSHGITLALITSSLKHHIPVLHST